MLVAGHFKLALGSSGKNSEEPRRAGAEGRAVLPGQGASCQRPGRASGKVMSPRIRLGEVLSSSSVRESCRRGTYPKNISLLSLRYNLLHRSTLSIFLARLQRRPVTVFSTTTTRAMPFKLPTLPDVPGADPSRAVLDAFKVAIAKRVADALPPLTAEQVYRGVNFMIALLRFRLSGVVDVLAKTASVRCVQSTNIICTALAHELTLHAARSRSRAVSSGRLRPVSHARQGVLAFHSQDSLPRPRGADAGPRAHIRCVIRQPRVWLEHVRGRQEGRGRVLVTEHRKELPRWPSPFDDHWRVFGESV